jgi:hypothetical protein
MRRTEKRSAGPLGTGRLIFDQHSDVVLRGGSRGLFLAGPGKEVNSIVRRPPMAGARDDVHLV